MTVLEDEKEAQIQHFVFLDKMLALFFFLNHLTFCSRTSENTKDDLKKQQTHPTF